jgi:hypothetical protein
VRAGGIPTDEPEGRVTMRRLIVRVLFVFTLAIDNFTLLFTSPYSRWMPPEVDSELRKFEQLDSTLCGTQKGRLSDRKRKRVGQFPVSAQKNDERKLVPRGFEPLLPT